jgi:hypothetical protein
MWTEAVRVALPGDLRSGTYRVYAGWYTYPDTARFQVLTDVDGAQNNLIFVGAFEME